MQDPNLNEALAAATARFQKRMRSRSIASIALLIIGSLLLYRGFADQHPLSQTFGVVFILYSGIIQARMWSAKRFVSDVRKELSRKPSSLHRGKCED